MLSDSIRARALIVVSLPTRKKKVDVSGVCHLSMLNSEALRAAYTPTDLVSSSATDHTLTIFTVPAF